MKHQECIFCKIINGHIEVDKIYDDENALAFLDINPVNYGHTLLISKQHYGKITDMPDNLLSEIFIRAKMLMNKIKKAMNADFVALAVVGVDVPHFHIHLVPRYFNDGLANFWPSKKYSAEESKKIAEKIIKAKE